MDALQGPSPTRSDDYYAGIFVSGASALTWARRVFRVSVPMIAIAGIVISEILLHWGFRTGGAFWIQFCVFGAFSLATATAIAIQARQAVREAKLGYTTVYNAYGEIVQVDPATRRIVRRPGEPFVTERQAKQMLKQPEATLGDSGGHDSQP